ncbi:hypothetical protein [Nitrososphaera viennensis]|nr:hypothetical protein [Nitrososphaera viennensis]
MSEFPSSVAQGVLIDNDILGWANSHEDELIRIYGKIVKVGSPDIPRRQPDHLLAAYCKDRDFDMLTRDNKAYTYYFTAGIKTVQLSRYDWDKKGDKPVYLIKIID